MLLSNFFIIKIKNQFFIINFLIIRKKYSRIIVTYRFHN